ncbi:MAG: hypothetical protein J5725_11880 [Bacteroidales bacterium]|nr:hypothetical protein [Bacteroidales bacterium]
MADKNLLESCENQKRGKRNSLFALIWHTILLTPYTTAGRSLEERRKALLRPARRRHATIGCLF